MITDIDKLLEFAKRRCKLLENLLGEIQPKTRKVDEFKELLSAHNCWLGIIASLDRLKKLEELVAKYENETRI